MEHLLKSLELNEQIGNQYSTANALHNVGSTLMRFGDFEKATSYFEKSLLLYKKLGDSKIQIGIYSNLAYAYNMAGDYDRAEKMLLETIKHIEGLAQLDVNQRVALSTSYNNLGMFYMERGKYNESEEFLLKSIQKADMWNMERDKFIAVVSYGELFLKQAKETSLSNQEREIKLESAINQLSVGAKELQTLGELNVSQIAYEKLSEAYTLQGNNALALSAYKQHIKLKDSVFNEKNHRDLIRKEQKYHFQKTQDSIRLETEKEIAIRDATLEANQRQKWFYFAGILGLAVIGGLLFYQNQLRKRKNSELQVLNKELDQANQVKTRFFSILNHDLRSPVSNLIQFLHLKTDAPEALDEATKNRLEQKSIQGAENLLVTMEDLLLWSKGQMENFQPQPQKVQVSKLFADTQKVFSGYQNIRFEYDNPENLEIFTDENYLKTIIRNLTSNAINAFTSTENPQISWKASREKGKTILSITDNGLGAESEKFKALYDEKEVVGIQSGLGLHLIRDLAKAINCEIDVNSQKGKGTQITLRLDS